jgi:hypothetical protein
MLYRGLPPVEFPDAVPGMLSTGYHCLYKFCIILLSVPSALVSSPQSREVKFSNDFSCKPYWKFDLTWALDSRLSASLRLEFHMSHQVGGDAVRPDIYYLPLLYATVYSGVSMGLFQWACEARVSQARSSVPIGIYAGTVAELLDQSTVSLNFCALEVWRSSAPL